MDELRSGYREIAGDDGPSEEEIIRALQTLGTAWNQVASAVEAAGRDEEVRRHLENAVASLGDAASAFLSELALTDSGREEAAS